LPLFFCRFIGTQQPIEVAGCHRQDAFSPWRIRRLIAPEALPSAATRWSHGNIAAKKAM
jgi:hypothetical protein